MEGSEPILGFSVPVHRALTEPILLGGAPRAVAILNGTLSLGSGSTFTMSNNHNGLQISTAVERS